MNNGQFAFRVTLHNRQEQVNPKASSGPKNLQGLHGFTRRVHTKSRSGCGPCKKRRKKCDEKTPKCSRCTENNIRCFYTNGQKSQLPSDTLVIAAPPNLWPGAPAPHVLTNSVETQHTKHDLFLLHHYVQYTCRDFETPENPVYSTQAIVIAKKYPYLMHAMLAVAACHLQHFEIDARHYRIAEALHCNLASRGLRNAVSKTVEGVEGADSILTTAMVLNTLTFCLVDYRNVGDAASAVDSGAKASWKLNWDWLKIQIGITDLLARTKPFHPQSMWMFLFVAQNTFVVTEPPINDLDTRLARFCDIDPAVEDEDNVYFEFWRRLAFIVTRSPSPEYLLPYLRAAGGITSPFIALLERGDSKAMVLFAHWLALMCSIDQWWCVRRTRSECWTCCDRLSTKLVGQDMKLLKVPAQACGYVVPPASAAW